MSIRSCARGRQHAPGTQSGQPAGPGLVEILTNCPPDHLDHDTCPCRELGRAKPCTALLQFCLSQGVLSPAPALTSTVRLPGVVLPSEGDVIEFSTLQLSEVLGAGRAVLRPHSQRSARWREQPALSARRAGAATGLPAATNTSPSRRWTPALTTGHCYSMAGASFLQS